MSQIYNGSFVLGNTSATTLSAGDGITIDTSVPGIIGFSNDETVLWNTITPQVTTTTAFDLTESFLNFEYIKIFYQNSFGGAGAFMNSIEALVPDETSDLEIPTVFPCGSDTSNQSFDRNVFCFTSAEPAQVTVKAAGSRINVSTTGSSLGCAVASSRGVRLLRIVGRNRKHNGGN